MYLKEICFQKVSLVYDVYLWVDLEKWGVQFK